MTELYFGRRFCGPPGMANGGFACGSIAALHGGAAEVTLRRPLPLERPLAARHRRPRRLACPGRRHAARPPSSRLVGTLVARQRFLRARRGHPVDQPRVKAGCGTCGEHVKTPVTRRAAPASSRLAPRPRQAGHRQSRRRRRARRLTSRRQPITARPAAKRSQGTSTSRSAAVSVRLPHCCDLGTRMHLLAERVTEHAR
jgi:hypothetical protein